MGRITKYTLTCILLLAGIVPAAFPLGWVGGDLSGQPCTGPLQGVGPYDYTNPTHRQSYLSLVERYHFTPNVRMLISGQASGTIHGDLGYTLVSFPNHHQALFSLIRYATEKDGLKHMKPECYLQRAERFAPEDSNVAVLFGLYLHRRNMYEKAREKYEKALSLQSDSAEAHYNLGLLLMDMEKPEEARKHARQAYKLGYPLPGLRDKLAKAGFPVQ